ncbi:MULTISPECIES: CarD family transcriptional regulator [Myxococcus]|uniref:CarD family transcriptional regulator n=1 Tax=Myxococcus TaxID=32 RepID=UPI0013D2FF8E|nr:MULTISPECIES: CarD family transcriptional regulator [Myxococcus]NVJ19785.1 transcriptional regulator [Myxococcus sp. AM011]
MPEGSASLNQLAVGDRVVYPNQGVCRVTAIDTKVVAGQSLVFVTMRREEDGAVVMVPEAKVVAIGVRKVANAEDVKSVFAFLRSDGDKADLDWKQRARTNLERMTQGGILGLAEVVKDLQILSELRPLPTKERELYDNARHLLVSEVAAALGTAEVNAEDAIDIVLFPPGRERPKRTAAEFARGEEDDLGLDGDLLGLDGDLDLPSEEEAPAEPAEEENSEEEGEESEEKSSDEDAPKKRGRPPKAKPEEAEGAEPAAPKKRGRPPKPKPEAPPPGAEPAAPKKRGRPPKAKPPEAEGAEPAAPKKRGRPPKAKPAEGGED